MRKLTDDEKWVLSEIQRTGLVPSRWHGLTDDLGKAGCVYVKKQDLQGRRFAMITGKGVDALKKGELP